MGILARTGKARTAAIRNAAKIVLFLWISCKNSAPSACFDFAGNLDEFENISLYEGAVEVILPEIVAQIKPTDLVVLDPPRAGLNAKARQALIDLNPMEIIYISCDPSTLARDLKHFSEAGYCLQNVHAFDMFPQTAHIETVVLMSRVEGK